MALFNIDALVSDTLDTLKPFRGDIFACWHSSRSLLYDNCRSERGSFLQTDKTIIVTTERVRHLFINVTRERLASVFDIFQMHLAADVIQSCSLIARELLLAKIANGFNSRCFHYKLFQYRPGSCYYPIRRDLYRFVPGDNKNIQSINGARATVLILT